MWPQETRAIVHSLIDSGCSIAEVIIATGVPRSTVKRWRSEGAEKRQPISVPASWSPPDERAYAFVLGMYLGDGHIVWGRRSGTVGFTLDARYPGVVAELAWALETTFPAAAVRLRPRSRERVIGVFSSTPLLGHAFPQHGAGKKHDRPIILEPWQ